MTIFALVRLVRRAGQRTPSDERMLSTRSLIGAAIRELAAVGSERGAGRLDRGADRPRAGRDADRRRRAPLAAPSPSGWPPAVDGDGRVMTPGPFRGKTRALSSPVTPGDLARAARQRRSQPPADARGTARCADDVHAGAVRARRSGRSDGARRRPVVGEQRRRPGQGRARLAQDRAAAVGAQPAPRWNPGPDVLFGVRGCSFRASVDEWRALRLADLQFWHRGEARLAHPRARRAGRRAADRAVRHQPAARPAPAGRAGGVVIHARFVCVVPAARAAGALSRRAALLRARPGRSVHRARHERRSPIPAAGSP